MKHDKLHNAFKPVDFKGGKPPSEDAVLLTSTHFVVQIPESHFL